MIDEFEDPGEVANPNEVKRDRWDRPMLPPVNTVVAKAEGDESPKTRVTTFAGSLDEQSNLSMWSQRLVAKGMAERADLRLLARSADLDADKSALNEVVTAAKELAGGPASSRLGTALHSFTEQRDRGGSDSLIDPEFLGHVNAYSAALVEHGIQILPDYVERLCCWEKYSVAGTFDRIVMWKGRPTVLDLKTGKDLGYGWLKIAVQLLCYAAADGIWNQASYSWEPMPEGLRTDVALVVHLPATGDAVCSVYEVDLAPAVDAARLCYEVREWRKMRNLATKLKPAPISDVVFVEIPEGQEDPTPRLTEDSHEQIEELQRQLAENLARRAIVDKPLSAQITEAVLSAKENARETGEAVAAVIKSVTEPKKRGRPRKLASVPPIEPLSFEEPEVETLEGADLDETITAAEAESVPPAASPIGRCTYCGQEHSEAVCPESAKEEEPADPFAELDNEPDPFAGTPETAEWDLPKPTPAELLLARIMDATSHVDLSQIRKEAMADGLWSDEMLKAGMTRLADLKNA